MSWEEHNVKRSCSTWQRPPPRNDTNAVSQPIHCWHHGVFTNGTEVSPHKRPYAPAMGVASIRLYVPQVSLSHGGGMTTVHRNRSTGASPTGSLYPLGSSSSYHASIRRLRRPVLMREGVRSQWANVRQSRQPWQHTATQRADEHRDPRQQLARVQHERDRATQARKEAQARLRQLESQRQGRAVQHKVALVCFALPLCFVARIGFRAVARVLSLLAVARGIHKAPCPHTILKWVTRRALGRRQSACMRKGSALSQAPFSHGLLWRIEVSMARGAGKIVAVLALDAQHPPLTQAAPGLGEGRGVAVSVAASWTGETIAALLTRVLAVLGRPAASRKDRGSARHKAIDWWDAQGLASPSRAALSHAVANRLKRRYQDHPTCATFGSACGRVSGKLTHTLLACRAPPSVHTTARFMHGHRLVTWADRLRNLSPAGGAKAGSTLATWRACLDAFPACQALSTHVRDDAVPLVACQKLLTTQGLSHDTLAQCAPRIDAIPSQAVRRECTGSLQSQLQTATTLGLDHVGLPISSEAIASFVGVAQQHGMGEMKDGNRMALRLPALCGPPTRQAAEQVLEVSVAAQQELTSRLTSCTKQRREVLPNPEALESLGEARAPKHRELMPSAKNRSNDQSTVDLSIRYKESCGPGLHRRNGHHRPASAVSSGRRERVSAS